MSSTPRKILKPKTTNAIQIRGARVHNLKNISLDIPRNAFVVITGLSGSGKSSLAFDTIYAEAERRFVESLSTYARQFLGVKDKPDVDSIEGLSPAISIDQKSVSRNPRSTVGTITEIYDYLRILFARAGVPHCPQCGSIVQRQTVDEIIGHILAFPEGSSLTLLSPLVRGRKGLHKQLLEEVARKGFIRARIDGEVMRMEEALDCEFDPKKKHSIEVVVDRVVVDNDIDRPRLAESIETALKIGKGVLLAAAKDTEKVFSEQYACPACAISLPELEPRLFSFNSPYGACAMCTGIGHTLEVDPALVFPNKNLTLAEGAIQPWARSSHRVGRQSWYWWMLEDLVHRHHFSLQTPICNLSSRIQHIILYGDVPVSAEPAKLAEHADASVTSGFEGVIPNLKRRWRETDSEWTRAEIEKYMHVEPCPSCKGARLKPEALSVTLLNCSIAEVVRKNMKALGSFFSEVERAHTGEQKKIISPLVKEIMGRLSFLENVGLHYITLDRESTTLSGGEAQRVRLATQIGSRLTGVMYVLD
ncbi:MAG: excinuclease ABC subunit UvrA, partial [Patescibacteria group bacterium]